MKKKSWFLSLCMFMFTILLSGCQEEVQPETVQDNAPTTVRNAAHGRAGSVTSEFTFTALQGGQVPFRFFPYGPTHAINLGHLASLQNFSMHNVATSRIIDFRQNPLIAFIDVSSTDVQDMLFSEHAPLTLVNILDNPGYSEKGFQELIHQAYWSATNNQINYGGLYIDLQTTYELIAPLTPRSKAELRVLRDIFHWDIYPNNF